MLSFRRVQKFPIFCAGNCCIVWVFMGSFWNINLANKSGYRFFVVVSSKHRIRYFTLFELYGYASDGLSMLANIYKFLGSFH